MITRSLLLAGFFLSLTGVAARADVIVEVQDATVSPNGTGYIDILISGTASDNLDSFQISASITGSVANGSLIFSAAQPDISAEADYVFLGDSGGYSGTQGSPTTDVSALDGTASFLGVTLTGTKKLVARFAFEHTETGVSVGDTYTVTLTGVGTDPLNDSTWFADSSITGLTIDLGASDLSGTITVASAVPEPGPLVLLGLSVCVGGGRHLLRRRKQPTQV